MVVLSALHGFYVDHASCIRGNEVRQTTITNAKQAVATLQARELAEPAALAQIDRLRQTQQQRLANEHLLDCSYPFPETR